MTWFQNLLTVRYAFTHDERKSKWRISARRTVDRAFAAIEQDAARYRLVVNGTEGPFRDPSSLKLRAVAVLENRHGANVAIRRYGSDGLRNDQVRLHRSVRERPVPDVGVAPELNRIHYAVWTTFSDVRTGGRYVCKYVSGTLIISFHGYRGSSWDGAAEDIFVSDPNTMAHLWDVALFIVDETLAGRLHADRVIVGDQMWTRGEGWSDYHGDYHTHIHVEVWEGTPCR